MSATVPFVIRKGLTLIVLCLTSGVACQQEEAPAGPSDVLMKFVGKMRQVHGKADDGDQVVELLWKPARDNLKERARRASALSGRELSPGELVVPSWFALHLPVERAEARIDGEWAEVTAFGSDGGSVQARCIREEGEWKVALELPPLAPIRMREKEE
jgi:hypothetical protein